MSDALRESGCIGGPGRILEFIRVVEKGGSRGKKIPPADFERPCVNIFTMFT